MVMKSSLQAASIEFSSWSQCAEEIMPIRFEVFVDEQDVPPELEEDEFDQDATHAILQFYGVTIGTARIFQKVKDSKVFYIGRLSVLKKYRGLGLGQYLMQALINKAKEFGAAECVLHAQSPTQSFYETFGFKPCSDTFTEAGIEHVKMQLYLS
jgi:predicted GNAT family N-acyltransferase